MSSIKFTFKVLNQLSSHLSINPSSCSNSGAVLWILPHPSTAALLTRGWASLNAASKTGPTWSTNNDGIWQRVETAMHLTAGFGSWLSLRMEFTTNNAESGWDLHILLKQDYGYINLYSECIERKILILI